MVADDAASIEEMLKGIIGQPTGSSRVVVERGPVSHFAEAVGSTSPIYRDPAAAAAYYTALTGHTVIEPSPGMQVLNVGEQWFASVSHNQVPERPGAQWNSIYVVETLEAARNKIRELGGTIVLEEMPVPGSAICVFVEPVMNTAVTIMGAGSQE